MTELTRHHIRRAALDLAVVYRGLASELLAAAAVLERAERSSDPRPTVQPNIFSAAIERGAVLHFLASMVAK